MRYMASMLKLPCIGCTVFLQFNLTLLCCYVSRVSSNWKRNVGIFPNTPTSCYNPLSTRESIRDGGAFWLLLWVFISLVRFWPINHFNLIRKQGITTNKIIFNNSRNYNKTDIMLIAWKLSTLLLLIFLFLM